MIKNGYFHFESLDYFRSKPEPQKPVEDAELWANLISDYNHRIIESESNRRLRSFIRASLHRLRAGESMELGYSLDELTSHLESLFTDGMEWANYGLWEIDHILPIQWFLDRGLAEVKIVNSLANLRPLWQEDNRAKGARFTHHELTDIQFYNALRLTVTH